LIFAVEIMILNESQIEKNVGWLLAKGSPPVRYLTHKYLKKDELNSPEMKKLWAEVEGCKIAQDIFSKQGPDGSWCAGGAWASKPSYTSPDGYEPTSPKYVTTAWILPILGDMGFDKRDSRIRRACNYMLTFQWRNGFFSDSRLLHRSGDSSEMPDSFNRPCHFSLFLLAFGKVAMGQDAQLKKSYDLLAGWQREDGGWLDERHKDGSAAPYVVWNRSCPWSTYHAVSALFYSNDPDYEENVRRGLEFLIWHYSIKDETMIRQFFYHGHSPVRELLMLSSLGLGLSERPIQVILDWLMTMYQPGKGYFKYSGKPISKYSRKKDGVTPQVMKYRLYHLIEDDWLTYYMTLIASRILKAKNVLTNIEQVET
jgi:hypothetical protein